MVGEVVRGHGRGAARKVGGRRHRRAGRAREALRDEVLESGSGPSWSARSTPSSTRSWRRRSAIRSSTLRRGCAARNAASRGTTSRAPKATGSATRSTPWRPWEPRRRRPPRRARAARRAPAPDRPHPPRSARRGGSCAAGAGRPGAPPTRPRAVTRRAGTDRAPDPRAKGCRSPRPGRTLRSRADGRSFVPRIGPMAAHGIPFGKDMDQVLEDVEFAET